MADAEDQQRRFENVFPSCLQVKAKDRIGTANFGVVICKSLETEENAPNEYLAVDEKKDRGWWLPAGFVDPGETVAAGAKRECVEEAGVHTELTGVLRIEYGECRCRFVYSALPIDNLQEPKSIPDSESNGAAWFTLKKMKQMMKSGIKFRGPELLNFGYQIDKGYIYPNMDFLIATYEDESPTWTRYNDCCPTDTHMKVIIIYEKIVYLEKNGMKLPNYAILPTVKNQKIRNWVKNALPFEVHPVLQRVVRVYHSMRNNGASMGFIFAIQATEKPGDDYVPVDLSKLEDVNAVDREILEFANDGAKCWKLCLLDSEIMEIRNPGAPDKLLESWRKLVKS